MQNNAGNGTDAEKAALAFLRKAASGYKPHQEQKDIVLEMHFTDIHKTYQLVLTKTECLILTEGFGPYTARAEGTYPLFDDLIKGRKNPAIALLRGQIKAKGDLKVLKKLDEYFPDIETEK